MVPVSSPCSPSLVAGTPDAELGPATVLGIHHQLHIKKARGVLHPCPKRPRDLIRERLFGSTHHARATKAAIIIHHRHTRMGLPLMRQYRPCHHQHTSTRLAFIVGQRRPCHYEHTSPRLALIVGQCRLWPPKLPTRTRSSRWINGGGPGSTHQNESA
jgi:hypothetical protein